MKTLTLTSIGLFILSSTLQAQQGKVIIGGAAGFNVYETSTQESITWSLSPEIGLWINHNTQIGALISYENSNQSFDFGTGPFENDQSSFTPTAYIRKWKNVSDLFGIYGGLNAGYIKNTSEFEENDGSGFRVYVDFGLAFNLSPKWSVMGRYALLGYSKSGETKLYGLSIDTVQNPFNLGLYYRLK